MPSQALIQATPPSAFATAAHIRINRKASQHTRDAYRRDLKNWIAFCDHLQLDPSRATIDHAALYRDHLHATLANESTRRSLAALSWLYRVLLADHLVSANPFHPGFITWPPAGTVGKTQLVSDSIANAMIEHAKDSPRDSAILRLLYDTGLRRESIVTLTRTNYRPPQIVAIVKGDKEQLIDLPAMTCAAIDRWLEVAPTSPYLINGRRGRIDLSTINRVVRLHATAVGAPAVHPHCFRAAWITSALDAEIPLHEVQAGAGHKDPKTTRRYDRGARGVTTAERVAAFRKGNR